MVLCKFFQQGTCRFGQYCKFEHSFANRSKTFNEDKNIALIVAQEVLAAERGGQWLLSCYGPFKERKCIPGLEDFSPEEVRWEMYQAQKNGKTDQIKAQFQQMCEATKAKFEALKSPTPAILKLLEEIQNTGSENTAFGDNSKLSKGNFTFGAPQLGISNANQSSTVFGQKSFGTAGNPFGTNTFNSNQAASTIFSSANANNANSVFGGKPSFGNSSLFSNSSTTGASIFGGASKSTATPFGMTQNVASFGTNVFGGAVTTQATFGQPSTFGASNVPSSNSFLKPQTSQNTMFGSATTTPMQGSNVFGSSVTASAPTNSVFGGAPAVSNVPPVSAGIFGQTGTSNATFSSTPVFGGSAGFGAMQTGTNASVFGGQSTFGAVAPVSVSNNVFGGAHASAANFGSLAQQGATAKTFGGTSTSQSVNAFETAPNATTPFGTSVSTATGPFGTINAPTNSVFATTTQSTPGPFSGGMPSFSKGTSFGFAAPTTNTTNIFGAPAVVSSTQSPFGTTTFAQSGSTMHTNTGSAVANPFTGNSQQQSTNSPFSANPSMQPSPFGNFTQSSGGSSFGVSLTVTIDETGYSLDESLTDDEKSAYKMKAFHEGFIPLNPPSKELR